MARPHVREGRDQDYPVYTTGPGTWTQQMSAYRMMSTYNILKIPDHLHSCLEIRTPTEYPMYSFFFNWGILALQCYVGFFCTTK